MPKVQLLVDGPPEESAKEPLLNRRKTKMGAEMGEDYETDEEEQVHTRRSSSARTSVPNGTNGVRFPEDVLEKEASNPASPSMAALRRGTQRFVQSLDKDLADRSAERLRTYAAGNFRRTSRDSEDSTGDDSSSIVSVTSVLEHEWYRKAFSFSHFMQEQYFYCYVVYLVGAVLLGTVGFSIADPEMELGDAFFSAACCVSQSGLSSLDWSKQKRSVHIISVFLIFAGSMPLLTLWPVLLRRHSFRQQMKIQEEEEMKRETMGKSPSTRSARQRARWTLEYRALEKCVVIVLFHWFFTQFVCMCVIASHSLASPAVSDRLAKYELNHWWHAFYLTISAFQNNGLALTPTSVEPLNDQPVPLLVVAFLIIVGNTGFPIVMRLLASLRHSTLSSGPDRDAYAFLLEHPRRCFTHMFPAVQTLWLIVVAAVLLFIQTAVFVHQNYDMPVLERMSFTDKVYNGFFQAASARTAGLNSVDINFLTCSTTYILMVCMYISTSPTVVIMRYSAESQAAEELDICGRPEGHEDQEEQETVGNQAKKHLYQHTTYLLLFTFMILCFERQSMNDSVEATCHITPPQLYGDFTVYKVLFEMASAYGTVGLSLGYRSSPASFSGSWSRPSQVLLAWVMLLGRLRGLPDSIDPSVAFTMKLRNEQTSFLSLSEPTSPAKVSREPSFSTRS